MCLPRPWTGHVCAIQSQAAHSTVQESCGYNLQRFYKPDPGPVHGFADPVPFPIHLHPAPAHIRGPASGVQAAPLRPAFAPMAVCICL